jgi:hypothetical protein
MRMSTASATLYLVVGLAGAAMAQAPQLSPPEIAILPGNNPTTPTRACFGTINNPLNNPTCSSSKFFPVGFGYTDAYLILSVDEMRKMSALLQQLIQSEGSVVTSVNTLNTTMTGTQTMWTNQAVAFAKVISDTITDRFNQLPLNVVQDPTFKKTIDDLRDDILKSVNDKLEAATRRNP